MADNDSQPNSLPIKDAHESYQNTNTGDSMEKNLTPSRSSSASSVKSDTNASNGTQNGKPDVVAEPIREKSNGKGIFRFKFRNFQVSPSSSPKSSPRPSSTEDSELPNDSESTRTKERNGSTATGCFSYSFLLTFKDSSDNKETQTAISTEPNSSSSQPITDFKAHYSHIENSLKNGEYFRFIYNIRCESC